MLHILLFILHYIQHVSLLSNHPQGDKVQRNVCNCTTTSEIAIRALLFVQINSTTNARTVHNTESKR